MRGGVRKWILKRAFAGRLPGPLLRCGKEGFSMPMKQWRADEWNGLLHELLSPSRPAAQGLFDARHAERLMREHESGAHKPSDLLCALMVFQLWCGRFDTAIGVPGVHVHAA